MTDRSKRCSACMQHTGTSALSQDFPKVSMKVKAELRVAQVEREYGSAALATVGSDAR